MQDKTQSDKARERKKVLVGLLLTFGIFVYILVYIWMHLPNK